MKHSPVSFALALSLATIGCKAKGGADCDRAIRHSMELSKDAMAKMGVDSALMQKMTDVGIRRCKEDQWTAAVTTCMSNAMTMTDAQACYGKMTQEQQDTMNAAAMELSTPPAPAAGPGSGSAGSAAGSAVTP